MSVGVGFQNRYSKFDQWLYRLVFATGAAQVAVADIEEALFAAELRGIDNPRPVFVTSLPRAGTTVLLEMLASLPDFATHRYCDMPFVLTPLLGELLGRSFRKASAPMERAHGDGMQISYDSPEAFEEMLWLRFWPAHYREDRISEWSSCDDPEFVRFFRAHMCKIIALRRRERPGADNGAPFRYASKNNLNIARIQSLRKAVPGALMVVPFRNPVQHAFSLLSQHLNFLRMHRDDEFSRIYMKGVGHFDFGANFKPIDFGGWLDSVPPSGRQPTQLSYWLRYWIAAYRHVLDHQDPAVRLVSYEGLCEQSSNSLSELGEFLGVSPRALRDRAAVLKRMEFRQVDCSGVEAGLIDESMVLHEELCRRASA